MRNSHYHAIDALISEYEEDVKTIKPERQMIRNYPKVLILSATSSFERYIKDDLEAFVRSPVSPIATTYPKISTLMRNKPNKPIADKIYAKLEGYDDNGIEHLDASNFYELFGGDTFKSTMESKYLDEKSGEKQKIEAKIVGLSSLVGTEEKYDEDYAKCTDIMDKLDLSTFDIAERAFLSMKLIRNRVAHNYLSGSSNTFEDIRGLFYDAVLYVVAMEKTIEEITVS